MTRSCRNMDSSPEIDQIVASCPAEFAPYVASNDILPSHLLPSLNHYLLQLQEAIRMLEAEGDDLEEHPESMQRSLRAKEALTAHLRIKAPIRRLPQDILGVLFPYAVDIPPFNRYIDVVRLRSVCSSWRHLALTTPGLWTSLHIDLSKWCGRELDDYDDEALLLHFKDFLAPWTSIMSKIRPYKLNIASSQTFREHKQIHNQNALVSYLLSSTPTPDTVTLISWSALTGALTSRSTSVHRLEVRTAVWKPASLKMVFPNLKILTSTSSFECDFLLAGHPSLQVLHLDNLRTKVYLFTAMMRALPALRELRLSSLTEYDVEATMQDSLGMYSHPALEVLLVSGEDLLWLCRYLAFPALRFFTLQGLDLWTRPIHSDEVIPRILSSFPSKGVLISLRGSFYRSLLERIIQHLPPTTFLHLAVSRINNRGHPSNAGFHTIAIASDNVEEIFCDDKGGDLSWVAKGPARRHSSCPLTIHVIKVGDATRIEQKRREELLREGYRLEEHNPEAIYSKFRSLAPEFTPDDPWASPA